LRSLRMWEPIRPVAPRRVAFFVICCFYFSFLTALLSSKNSICTVNPLSNRHNKSIYTCILSNYPEFGVIKITKYYRNIRRSTAVQLLPLHQYLPRSTSFLYLPDSFWRMLIRISLTNMHLYFPFSDKSC